MNAEGELERARNAARARMREDLFADAAREDQGIQAAERAAGNT